MIGDGDVVTVVNADGTIRASTSTVRRRGDITAETVADPEALTLALQAQSRAVDELYRKAPRPRMVFRVDVPTGGGGYITTRLRHNLGSSVLVRLESTESTYAGTLAPAVNYQTDESTDAIAVVHVAQSASVAYTAVIGVEPV